MLLVLYDSADWSTPFCTCSLHTAEAPSEKCFWAVSSHSIDHLLRAWRWDSCGLLYAIYLLHSWWKNWTFMLQPQRNTSDWIRLMAKEVHQRVVRFHVKLPTLQIISTPSLRPQPNMSQNDKKQVLLSNIFLLFCFWVSLDNFWAATWLDKAIHPFPDLFWIGPDSLVYHCVFISHQNEGRHRLHPHLRSHLLASPLNTPNK